MATRCLYCGQSSGWGRLKRLLDDQFCNSAHREAYNERLRKIVIDLSKYQRHSAEGARADSDPAITHLAMQLGRDPRLMGDPVSVVPTITSPTSSDPRMLSVMCLPRDCSCADGLWFRWHGRSFARHNEPPCPADGAQRCQRGTDHRDGVAVQIANAGDTTAER